jgi:hypothetical protein
MSRLSGKIGRLYVQQNGLAIVFVPSDGGDDMRCNTQVGAQFHPVNYPRSTWVRGAEEAAFYMYMSEGIIRDMDDSKYPSEAMSQDDAYWQKYAKQTTAQLS